MMKLVKIYGTSQDLRRSFQEFKKNFIPWKYSLTISQCRPGIFLFRESKTSNYFHVKELIEHIPEDYFDRAGRHTTCV